MVMDFLIHRVSRSVYCTLRWGVINIPHHTVQRMWCRIQPMNDFSKFARKNILASSWNCSQSSQMGQVEMSVCVRECWQWREPYTRPVPVSSPSLWSPLFAVYKWGCDVQTCISWTMMWRRVRVLYNTATAVSDPDHLHFSEDCWIKWKRFCKNWFRVSHYCIAMFLRAGLWSFSHHIPYGKGTIAVVHGSCPAKSWEKCIIRWFLKLLYLKWAHVWGRRMGDSSYSYALYTASVCRWSRRLWDYLLLYYDVTPGVHITHITLL